MPPPAPVRGSTKFFNGTLLTGTATYWTAAGIATTCQLDLPNGDPVDVGVADVFNTSCDPTMFANLGTIPAGIGAFEGPIQVMNYVVPVASSQTAISAAAAYFVYGFGQNGGVMPWVNNNFIFQRGASSGTQSMLAAGPEGNLVPPTKWNGVVESSSALMIPAIENSTSPEATIGILASEDADPIRASIKELAYQTWGQECAWLPDSSPTSFDKLNVRQGRYAIWGPIHFYAKVNSSGTPTNAAAANLIGFQRHGRDSRGRQPPPDRDPGPRHPPMRDAGAALDRGRPGDPVHADDALRLLLRLHGHGEHHLRVVQHGRQLHGRGRVPLPLRLLRGELT